MGFSNAQHAASLTVRTAAAAVAASELRRTFSAGRMHGGGSEPNSRGSRERRYSFSEMRSWEGLQVRHEQFVLFMSSPYSAGVCRVLVAASLISEQRINRRRLAENVVPCQSVAPSAVLQNLQPAGRCRSQLHTPVFRTLSTRPNPNPS